MFISACPHRDHSRYTQIHTHTHVHTHTHTYTYKFVHTHTHTHTPAAFRNWLAYSSVPVPMQITCTQPVTPEFSVIWWLVHVTHTYIHAYVHIYNIYTYILYTYIHVYVYIYNMYLHICIIHICITCTQHVNPKFMCIIYMSHIYVYNIYVTYTLLAPRT